MDDEFEPYMEEPEPVAPLKTDARRDWAEIAEKLRAHPGEMFVIDEDGYRSEVAVLKSGRNRAFQPPEEWHFEGRGYEGQRVGKVYGMYVGKKGGR